MTYGVWIPGGEVDGDGSSDGLAVQDLCEEDDERVSLAE